MKRAWDSVSKNEAPKMMPASSIFNAHEGKERLNAVFIPRIVAAPPIEVDGLGEE